MDRDKTGAKPKDCSNIEDSQDVQYLVQQLEHKDWVRREKAAERLGKIGNPETISYLLPYLKDDKCWVRWAVARALGRIQARITRKSHPEQENLRKKIYDLRKNERKEEVVFELYHVWRDAATRRFLWPNILKEKVIDRLMKIKVGGEFNIIFAKIIFPEATIYDILLKLRVKYINFINNNYKLIKKNKSL